MGYMEDPDESVSSDVRDVMKTRPEESEEVEPIEDSYLTVDETGPNTKYEDPDQSTTTDVILPSNVRQKDGYDPDGRDYKAEVAEYKPFEYRTETAVYRVRGLPLKHLDYYHMFILILLAFQCAIYAVFDYYMEEHEEIRRRRLRTDHGTGCYAAQGLIEILLLAHTINVFAQWLASNRTEQEVSPAQIERNPKNPWFPFNNPSVKVLPSEDTSELVDDTESTFSNQIPIQKNPLPLPRSPSPPREQHYIEVEPPVPPEVEIKEVVEEEPYQRSRPFPSNNKPQRKRFRKRGRARSSPVPFPSPSKSRADSLTITPPEDLTHVEVKKTGLILLVFVL